MLQKSVIRLFAVLIVLVGLSSVIYAQGGPLAYGTTDAGTLAPGSPIIYTFTGTADDLVTVYVIGSSDLQASLSVSNSSGQPLGFSNDDVLTPMSNDVRVTAKLPANDTYIITLNNQGTTAGDFFLSISVADPIAPMQILDRTVVTIEPNSTAQAFAIAPNPAISQVVSVQALSPSEFSAHLYSDDGRLLASIPSGLGGATFVLPASTTGYTLVVNSSDPTTGTQVEIAILAGGAQPSVPSPAITEEAQVTDPNVCTVTSNAVNVRRGPGTNYDTIGSLGQGSQFIATGQNSGWYYGIYNGQSAWVAASVVTAVGNCNLPFVDAPPAPATSVPAQATTATNNQPTSTATATTDSNTQNQQPTSTSTTTPTATATTQAFTVISISCRYFQNDGATVDFHVEGAPSTTFQIDVRQGSTTYSTSKTMNQQGFLNANHRFGQAGNSNYTAYIVYNGVDQANAEC